MKIGVISDTHGSAAAFKEVVEGLFSDVDFIIHCGDICYHGARNPLPSGYDTSALARHINEISIPIAICKGNCDSEVDQMVIKHPIMSPYLIFQFGRLRILAHHGHLFSDQEISALTNVWGISLCISGHTHIPRLEKQGSTFFLNPGSPSLPKGEKFFTAGIVEISEKEETLFLSVLDLKKREILAKQASMTATIKP